MPDALANPALHPADRLPASVLVADDDPASRRFLSDGLRSLGARVVACADGNSALAHARGEMFDLLLLDCRMPDAGALQILEALRGDSGARSADSLAVASTAELGAPGRSALIAAGFREILLKPCTTADLRRLLALLPIQPGVLLLDDHAALDASGDATTMHALRGLLREELEQIQRELDQLSRDRHGFGERLHRLRSSCGFCGATRLSDAVVALQRQLAQTPDDIAPSLQRFGQVLAATLLALDR